MKNMSDAFSIDYAFLQKSPVIKKNACVAGTTCRDVITVPLFFSPLPPPPRAIILDAHPLSTFENQDTCDGKTRYI